MLLRRAFLGFWLALAGAASSTSPARAETALAAHGEPALAAPFPAFPFVNPEAPKGGRLSLCFLGTFDSLNPFNLKAGSTAQGLVANVYESLMTRSPDEPFTLYGLIAASLDTNDDRSFVTFHLDPKAHFSDGTPIRATDVLFSFDLLKHKGRPQQRAAFALVTSATAPDPLTVHFDLAGLDDREMPLTLGLMPILSKQHTDAATFDNTTLAPPIASGPYRITAVDPGQKLTLTRDPDYWAKDSAARRGMFNFDTVSLTYYRDANGLFEAFKAGLCDYRVETDPTRWLTGYDIPAVRDGRIVKLAVPSGLPKGMEGIAFNTRRVPFGEIRVREALADMFDFEWLDTNLFGGLYTRTNSFFADSELSAAGHPADARERALLAPFPGAVTPEIMAGTWAPSKTDGSGRDRRTAEAALALLKAAGYHLQGPTLVDKAGAPLAFEIMTVNRSQERLALIYADSLRRIGVDLRVRLVDEVQYQRRRQNFDFDLMFGTWTASPSPGMEQRSRWGSAGADQPASFNLAGARSPALDAMINAMLAARTHDDFVAAVRAYDRILLSGSYIVPLYHTAEQWIAYWSRIEHPARFPLFGVADTNSRSGNTTPSETWWKRP